MIKHINTGEDNTVGDRMCDAFRKINDNFKMISETNSIEVKHIKWNSNNDNKKAFEDINENFKKIKCGKSIKLQVVDNKNEKLFDFLVYLNSIEYCEGTSKLSPYSADITFEIL